MIKISKQGKEFFVQDDKAFFVANVFKKITNFYLKVRKLPCFDSNKFWSNVQDNKWESNTFTIFDKFLDKNYSFIDIGAWIGPTVLYGCQIAKHCYAVEPDPVALKNLEKNIELNPGLKNKITLFKGCLSDTNGIIDLYCRASFGNSLSGILFKQLRRSVKVNSLIFDTFINKYNIKDCNFIKIDIEGGEIIVLPTMLDFIKSYKPTLHLSLHPGFFPNLEEDSNKIISILQEYKHIFDNNGNSMSLKELLKNYLLRKSLFDIVATDKSW